MKNRFNKPRVFLSHSKKDSAFIDRVFADLQKCQIEPWLDSYEIRHGEPWLDAIFENGMPSCDAVLIYLTDSSIDSPVVRKEIDAGMLQKLRDSRIAFLPYVLDASIRTQLRIDLQSLQAPEWNAQNYNDLLPKVVAEIWRSFLERTVGQAIQHERVARLEAELRVRELEKQQESGGFSAAEAQDFEYIWKVIDRYEPVVFIHKTGMAESDPIIGRKSAGIHVGSLLLELSGASKNEYDRHATLGLAASFSRKNQELKMVLGTGIIEVESWPDIGGELLRYGFLTRLYRPRQESEKSLRSVFGRGSSFGLMFTERLERFKYWLVRNGHLQDTVRWGPVISISD